MLQNSVTEEPSLIAVIQGIQLSKEIHIRGLLVRCFQPRTHQSHVNEASFKYLDKVSEEFSVTSCV
jgi:hypothetical protein